MRSDAESIVIVVWVSLALVLLAAVIYDGIGAGQWPAHIAILAVGELLIAGVAWLALKPARRR